MSLWNHQTRMVEGALEAQARGVRRLLCTTPTGGGKTKAACELIGRWLERGLRGVLYTNRRPMIDQLSGVLKREGLTHGVRAAGYSPDRGLDVQVSSMPTEHARSEGQVLKRELRRGLDAAEAAERARAVAASWGLHDAGWVLVDEAHLQSGPSAQAVINAHADAGAFVVGMTATPLGLGDVYDELLVAGTNSELRKCGALVPCIQYSPDEPDLRHVGRFPLGEDPTAKQNAQAIMRPGVFGRVYEHWKKLNPDARATILFGPDVSGSLYFAEQFAQKGVRAAHIDGKEVWLDGKTYRRTHDAADPFWDILEGSRDGSVKLLCNRFVMREGIDAPWLFHGIAATIFGSLQSFLQSGGRLLRSHPSLDHVVWQDHGGNGWRHGSLNADQHWELCYTAAMVAGMRQERMRSKQEKEPAVCPQCSMILMGVRCRCGFVLDLQRKSRPVIQSDGRLIQMYGDIYRPRKVSQQPDAEAVWRSVYFRAKKAGLTFNAAEALFAKENGWYYPPRTLSLMPLSQVDWFRKVGEVPSERLTGIPPPRHKAQTKGLFD